MPCPIALPFEVWRIDLKLCAESFRIGRLSEAGFRHHLTRLGYAAHELDAEVEHHRTERHCRCVGHGYRIDYPCPSCPREAA